MGKVPGTGRDVTLATTGIKLDGHAPRLDAPPPQIGQDNARIWGELGYDANDLARLKDEGII